MQDDNAAAWKDQGTAAALVPATTNSPELEIKDAQLIFGAIWRELEGEFGRSRMRFPRVRKERDRSDKRESERRREWNWDRGWKKFKFGGGRGGEGAGVANKQGGS
jgi:hypothetical protein